MKNMTPRPPSFSLGVGLSVVAMSVCLALVTYEDANPDSSTTSATALASPSPEVKQSFGEVSAPQIAGVPRFKETLEYAALEFPEASGVSFSSQWLRDGEPIANATETRYRLGIDDVGHRISVAVTAQKSGFEPLTVTSETTEEIGHLKDARTTVKYQIASRGEHNTDIDDFRAEVAKILADPRGWRSDGIVFEEVESGAPMIVYIASAETLPSFSSHCSVNWSCRAGVHVVINQNRWENATEMWNAQKITTLAAYRHMVVNHEVGHWLGWSHQGCGGAGELAPLMMQQSKGLNGCKPNPWPLESEKNPPRFR